MLGSKSVIFKRNMKFGLLTFLNGRIKNSAYEQSLGNKGSVIEFFKTPIGRNINRF